MFSAYEHQTNPEMEKVKNVKSWEEVGIFFIISGKFKETGKVIPPLTLQTPVKKEASSKREELESSNMELDSIHPSKNIKANHD